MLRCWPSLPSPSQPAHRLGDAELIALAAEIDRLCALDDEIYAKRLDPFHQNWQRLIDDALAVRGTDQTDFEERWEKAWAYSRESGREAGIDEATAVDEQADRVWKRMTAIPAATQAGRAAKVHALLAHVCISKWRGPKSDLDWDIEQARALLGEFAGMSEEELASI